MQNEPFDDVPNLPWCQFESVASRASHVTLQTVHVWELDTLLNVLLIVPSTCYMHACMVANKGPSL